MLLRADHRERAILPFIRLQFDCAKLKIKEEQLKIADFHLVEQKHGSTVAIIERKTWKDLGHSLKDGRVWNFNKFNSFVDADISNQGLSPCSKFISSSSCLKILVVEGRKLGVKRKRGGVQEHTLRKLIDSLMFRHNIHVKFTASGQKTAQLLKDLALNYLWSRNFVLVSVPSVGLEEQGDTQQIDKRAFEETADRVKKVFVGIPGISFMTATSLVNQKVSLQKLFTNLETQTLANIRYPSGTKIGSYRAHNIVKAVRMPSVRLKVVLRLPGVGKKNSSRFLEFFERENFCITPKLTKAFPTLVPKLEQVWTFQI